MSTVKLIEYDEADAEVRAVYDDIRRARQTDYINNFWKALANYPATLKRVWSGAKEVMAPGEIDALAWAGLQQVWGRTCITVDNHLILPTNLSKNELVSALEGAFSYTNRQLKKYYLSA